MKLNNGIPFPMDARTRSEILRENKSILHGMHALHECYESGIITAQRLQDDLHMMEDKRRQLLKKLHPYTIRKITAPDGKGRCPRTRWTTRVPDPESKSGYRQIRSSSEDTFFQMLYQHYGLSGNGLLTVSLASLYPEWINYRLSEVSKGTVKKDQSVWDRYYRDDPITERPLATIKPSEALRWLSETVITHHLTKRYYDFGSQVPDPSAADAVSNAFRRKIAT